MATERLQPRPYIRLLLLVGLLVEIFGGLCVFSENMPQLTDLLLAVPLGLVGATAGGGFILLFRALRKLVEPMRNHVILRGLLGGRGLGVAGAFLLAALKLVVRAAPHPGNDVSGGLPNGRTGV
jgi:hypothetical protein